MQKSRISLVVKILVAFCLVYFAFKQVPLALVASHIMHADLMLLCLAVAAQLLSLFMSSVRSRNYFSYYGLNLTYTDSACLYYIGAMFNVIFPGGIGGDGYKILLLSKVYNFSKVKSFKVILYERANGLYALCVLCLAILPFTPFYNISTSLRLLIILCIIIVTPCYFLGAKYILKDKIEIITSAVPISFVVQILQLLSACCVIYAIDINTSYDVVRLYSVIFLIASIIAVIPISIGGAGIRELVFLEASHIVGSLDPSVAASIAVLMFLITIISAVFSLPIWLLHSFGNINDSKRLI